ARSLNHRTSNSELRPKVESRRSAIRRESSCGSPEDLYSLFRPVPQRWFVRLKGRNDGLQANGPASIWQSIISSNRLSPRSVRKCADGEMAAIPRGHRL